MESYNLKWITDIVKVMSRQILYNTTEIMSNEEKTYESNVTKGQ